MKKTNLGILKTLLYIIGYTFAFYLLSKVFKSFYIENNYGLLYSFIAVIIIYILNKTIRPLLLSLILRISVIIYGIFYFIINIVILKSIDLIMGPRIDFNNFWVLVLISVLISIINLFIDLIIIKPIIKRVK